MGYLQLQCLLNAGTVAVVTPSGACAPGFEVGIGRSNGDLDFVSKRIIEGVVVRIVHEVGVELVSSVGSVRKYLICGYLGIVVVPVEEDDVNMILFQWRKARIKMLQRGCADNSSRPRGPAVEASPDGIIVAESVWCDDDCFVMGYGRFIPHRDQRWRRGGKRGEDFV